MTTKQLNNIISIASLTISEDISERDAIERIASILSESPISERVEISTTLIVDHIATIKRDFKKRNHKLVYGY